MFDDVSDRSTYFGRYLTQFSIIFTIKFSSPNKLSLPFTDVLDKYLFIQDISPII